MDSQHFNRKRQKIKTDISLITMKRIKLRESQFEKTIRKVEDTARSFEPIDRDKTIKPEMMED